jgi:hypothetical protein
MQTAPQIDSTPEQKRVARIAALETAIHTDNVELEHLRGDGVTPDSPEILAMVKEKMAAGLSREHALTSARLQFKEDHR